jgi:hypothetical protein
MASRAQAENIPGCNVLKHFWMVVFQRARLILKCQALPDTLPTDGEIASAKMANVKTTVLPKNKATKEQK